MKTIAKWIIAAGVIMPFTSTSRASDEPVGIAHADRGTPEEAVSHPTISEDGTWAGALMILILGGLFLPAMVIGPIVRILMPEPTADPHAHDDHAHGHDAHGTDAHGH